MHIHTFKPYSRSRSCLTMQNLVVFSSVPAQQHARYWSAVECSLYAEFHAPLRHNWHKSAFVLPAATPAARIAGFSSSWPFFSSLPRSCVHGAVASTSKPHIDLPYAFFASFSLDSTVIQQCSCCVYFRQSQEINDSVCARCTGADVGWMVLAIHLHQSEALIFECFVTPETFDIENVSPSQVHASASCRELRLNRYVHATEVGNRFL